MNFHINAVGKVKFPSGKEENYRDSFNCFQTPSAITAKIFASGTTTEEYIESYKKWVLETDRSFEDDILDYETWDEKTSYYKVVGKKKINPSKDHVKELNRFLLKNKERGMKVECFSM